MNLSIMDKQCQAKYNRERKLQVIQYYYENGANIYKPTYTKLQSISMSTKIMLSGGFVRRKKFSRLAKVPYVLDLVLPSIPNLERHFWMASKSFTMKVKKSRPTGFE